MTVRINFKLLYIFIILFLTTCTPDIKYKTANKKKQQVKTNAIAKLKTQAGGKGATHVTGPAHATMPKPVNKAKLQKKTAIVNNNITAVSVAKKDNLKVKTIVPKLNVKTAVPESNRNKISLKTNAKTAIPGSGISRTNQGDSTKVAVRSPAGSSTTKSTTVTQTEHYNADGYIVDTPSTRPDNKPATPNTDKLMAPTGGESLKPDALLVRVNTFERALKMKMDSLANASMPEFNKQATMMPNDAMQSVMTPSGFGGYGTYLFGGIGGVYPAVYTTQADLVGSVGFCVGNSDKAINFATSINIGKVHNLSDLTANFIISRRVFTGSSISLGGLQLLASSILSDAPGETFYFAFSHAIQTVPSKTPGYSALTYTIGVGNGRFLLKSPDDIAAGRGKYGTAVFGNISYEIMRRVNLNAEWTGMNLGISTGIRPLAGSPFSFGLGVTDLTRYSSDKPSMIFSMGYPLSLTR